MSGTLDFRVLFDAVASPHMVLDRQLRYVAANPAYLAIVHASRDDLLGRPLMDVFPENGDSGQRLLASFDKVFTTGEPDTLAFLTYPMPDPDRPGQTRMRYWTCVHTPIKDETGQTNFLVQNTVDVTDLVQLKEASRPPFGLAREEVALLERAREAERQQQKAQADLSNFRRLFERAPGSIAVLWGPTHIFAFANNEYRKLVGRNVVGLPIREALPEIDGQGFFEMLDEVYTTGRRRSGQNQRVLLRDEPSAAPREAYLDFSYDPITDDSGAVNAILVQAMDRTESVLASNRQRVLLDELNHRVKNTLATVQSIAKQTLRDSEGVVAARTAFEARILALSHAHDLLSLSNWNGAHLNAIVQRELAPFAPRVQIEGPDVRLPPFCTVPLGMMLHELTTNAARHGAFSTPEGRVAVTWQLDPTDQSDHAQLSLRWREEGGPPVEPPRRRGFGSRLIAMAVQGELNGRADLHFDRTGVRCDISIPFAMDGMAHGPV